MSNEPKDSLDRRLIPPVICYPNKTLPKPNLKLYSKARKGAKKTEEIIIPPRDAAHFRVKAGQFFRITSIEGPQVGDLNLWNSENLHEAFYTGKTRALHGSHLTKSNQLWSCFPYLRPMATIVEDTLEWYGIDSFGASVHDVIGTRCDPYTQKLLSGRDYHYCCHSNLCRALSTATGKSIDQIEMMVHDVLNVFMCTGFTRETGQYFMKASPVRPGDYLEFFAEIELLGALSTCPGGDCSVTHSNNSAVCFPLMIEIYTPDETTLVNGSNNRWTSPEINSYNQNHGE